MKYINIISLLLTLSSFTLKNKPAFKPNFYTYHQIIHLKNNLALKDSTFSYDAICYLVIADTNKNYYLLNRKMYELNQKIGIKIDTLGRHYNKNKNEIVLPDNDADEIYAGSYFPRRATQENLSLEYLSYYQKSANKKTIALVTGIYSNKKYAEIAHKKIKKTAPHSFILKAKIYMGCLH